MEANEHLEVLGSRVHALGRCQDQLSSSGSSAAAPNTRNGFALTLHPLWFKQAVQHACVCALSASPPFAAAVTLAKPMLIVYSGSAACRY